MHFRAFASVAVVACAAHVSASANAEPQPYKLAMMPVLGMSLMRRDTNGYQPEQSQCHQGTTCSDACGSGYTQCPSNDNVVHCFNPAVKQNCCSDGSGNSCDDGYYCTHDHALQTWCCPNNMDLAACAAAYSVTGGLETAASTTSAAPTSTSPTTTAAPTTTASPSGLVAEELRTTTTTVCPSSSGYTTAWSGGHNSTVTGGAPTQPYQSSAVQTAPASITPGAPQPSHTGIINGAASSGVSALLLLAAGVVALL